MAHLERKQSTGRRIAFATFANDDSPDADDDKADEVGRTIPNSSNVATTNEKRHSAEQKRSHGSDENRRFSTGGNRLSKIMINKVTPAVDTGIYVEAAVTPTLTQDDTQRLEKLEQKSKKTRKTGGLTVLPSKVAFEGALAVAKKPEKKTRSMFEILIPKTKKPIADPTTAATTQKKRTQKFEKYPTTVETGTRTFGSLVEKLRQIYGETFKGAGGASKFKKKKQKKQGDSSSSEDEETKTKRAKEIREETLRNLRRRLYKDQSDIIDEFLTERRDCERKLVFEEATIPTWVKYFWKTAFSLFSTSCLLLFSVFYGTYAAIFRNHSSDTQILAILDICIGADCIIRLLVEFWRSWTKCQYEVFTVNYTFLLALLDLIALIPFSHVILVYTDTTNISHLEMVPLFFLAKACFTFRMLKILDKLQDDMNIRGNVKFFIVLLRSIIKYLLAVHFLSCLIFFVGQRDINDVSGNPFLKSYLDWLLNRDPESASDKEFVTFLTIRLHLAKPPEEFYQPFPEPVGLYSWALYIVVATISTTGFGDVFPTNNTERILIILMMMIGSIWISGELAYNLGTFFTDLDSTRYMMFFRVKCIKIHLQNYQVSNFISTRTERYYIHLWRYRKGVHEIDLSYLPHCVQEELRFDVCEEMFYKSPIFRGLDETFLMVLGKSAKVSLYSPRMILYEKGSITKQMCFILQGEVAVAAGLDDDHISAIHRAGCLIGEVNLFMAIPYEQTIYTRTVCTIMTITKKDLMLAVQNFPHIFSIMRDRFKKRRERFRKAFHLVDAHPYVQWVYPNSLEDLKCDPEFPVKVTSMKGWNKQVTGFPIENENEQVIIEMPCLRKDLKRTEARAYRLVSVPQIYYAPGFWASVLNGIMLSLWFYICWVTPGCATYDDFGEEAYFPPCLLMSRYWYVIIFACMVDFIVELVTACPSTGLYYKIMDGIAVKIGSIGFYCDFLSMIPFELFYTSWICALFRMTLKLWKIGRMWDYLDERFALKLFYIRIAKMTYYLIYLTYIIALWVLSLVCESGRKNTECNEISFYNPSYPDSRYTRLRDDQNAEQFIFLTPVVFVSSALTSVGFGTIFPQTTKEVKWIIFIMIIGHFFCSYILAQLTSALSARLTPKLIFHQKLLVVKTFVRHNGLSTTLLRKLVEHYDLQHQYVRECSLPQSTHLMYDGHRVLLEDVFLVEGEIFFDGVPAFAKIPSQAIIDMSRLMQRFVVPPDLVFVQRGEVRRTLYIIVNGSVALYQHGEKAASSILTSTGHFGLRDLMFGEPYPYKVKTLSYVVLYAVDYSTFQEVLGDDEGLMEFIKDEMKRREQEIHTYVHTKIVDEDGPSQRQIFPPSWIYYADHPDKPLIGGDITFDQYEKPFLYYRGSNFIRENTMPQVIHPAGTFGLLWQALMGLAAVANLMSLVIETFMGYRPPAFRYAQLLLDFLFCADIYMKCHWAYYSAGAGEMRYHPLKTWVRYIFRGPFFVEVAMMIPLEFIIAFSGSTDLFGYGPGHSWFTKLRWIRLLRSLKFVELYTIVHRIFENRTRVMFLFYLSITMLASTILAAVAFFFSCPTQGYLWTKGDEYKLPVCLQRTWVDQKADEKLELVKRWNRSLLSKEVSYTDSFGDITGIFFARTFLERIILGLYYVGQVLMVIGFGDLATFRTIELKFLTSVALFGFIVCQSIISDITSAQIDTDEVRAVNREKLERLSIALSREGAKNSFKHYVRAAFRLSWSYAKGLQPNDLFSDLHPVLHRELLTEYIGDVMDRVPIFIGFTDAFINALKFKLKIEFYPKGGPVTRAGDLDYRMYIIVKGDVWICDRNERWICTMSTGESIGEMSMLYSAKRRFSAYAATNVEVLVLEAIDFASLLDNYPIQRKVILKSLLDYKRETYLIKSWKQKVENFEAYLKEQEEKTELLKEFSFQSTSHIPVRGNVLQTDMDKESDKEPGFFQKIVGYGSRDIITHYIYFASDNNRFNFVIHPSCKFIIHFQRIVQAVNFFCPMIVLFHVFFYVDEFQDTDVTTWTRLLSSTFDIILWINMALKLFTAVEVSERKTYCKDLKKIIFDYLSQPEKFLYDLLVAFPYDYATGNKGTTLMGLRCLLSVNYFSNMLKLTEDIEISTLRVNITTSTSFLVYLAHILACLFFWLSCPNVKEGVDKCTTNGWLYKFRVEFGKTYKHSAESDIPPGLDSNDLKSLYSDPRPSHWYVISLYWVMAVLTTCGFGDITPTTFDETALAVFCIFFGSLFLSILLGNITTGLSSVNQAKHLFFGRVEKMLDYLEVIGLSSVGHQTLSAYCDMTWTNCRGVNYNEIADILPLYVQQEVYLALYHKCITNCLFFGKNYDISFVRTICPRLRHFMFLPGMRICNELEPGTGIYIVMRGAVTSFQNNPNTGEREFIKRYEKNQVFGRVPALFPGALYNKCYRAEDKTEVLLMYHADMRQLLTKYPMWRIFLQEMIGEEYSGFSKHVDIKPITENVFDISEKLTKDLTYEQFKQAANLFASKVPNRKGIIYRERKQHVNYLNQNQKGGSLSSEASSYTGFSAQVNQPTEIVTETETKKKRKKYKR